MTQALSKRYPAFGVLREESRPILHHAATVLVGQLAVMAFGVTDTVIAGHINPEAMATLSLASSIYISVYVALNGLLQALLPTWAQLYGAGRWPELGRSVRQSLYVFAMGSGLGIAALYCPEPWLELTGVPPISWLPVQQYLHILAMALVPSLLFRLFGTLNQSLGMPRWVTGLQAIGLFVKVPLSAVLTWGIGSWPGLGIVGCAWATLTVNSFMCILGFWIMHTTTVYRPLRLWQWPERPDWRVILRFLQLGIPAGLSVMVEVTSFTLMALFIARLGPMALASHQIAASMAAVLYMVPLSMGIAASARTSYWLGKNDAQRAQQSAAAGLILTAMLALLCAMTAYLARGALASIYVHDPQVATAAAALLGWVCLYHLADAMQAVSVFLLRCWRITLMPLLTYTVLLWGVGLAGGYDLAYGGWGPWPKQGSAVSFWITSSLALVIVATLFFRRVWRILHSAT